MIAGNQARRSNEPTMGTIGWALGDAEDVKVFFDSFPTANQTAANRSQLYAQVHFPSCWCVDDATRWFRL